MSPNRSGRNLVLVVRKAPRFRHRAIVQVGALFFQGAIGRNGITARKREGDGATPLAVMALREGYARRDRGSVPASGLVLRSTRRDDLWCDAAFHARYNRPVKAPFAPSHEEMHRRDELYDICIVLDWNVTMRKQGAGSAIFFHLIRPGYEPTAGCVALSRRDMVRLLPHLRRGTRIKVMR